MLCLPGEGEGRGIANNTAPARVRETQPPGEGVYKPGLRSSSYGHVKSTEGANSAPPCARFSNYRSSASHEVEDDGNRGQYQQNVNEERGDMEYEKASQPQQQQNESKN